ncbi:FkbM family methyltransferase [Roseibium sp. TrichSKD4]|uniref:FkbM family methyltransferase n=1 Tax=Roseibium sp. TrichSKD4 TaxID=744980 RepID=UPI0001E56F36|nr:FkbM family methyltransferase [Roseibium sp. TrichSKD4]EFO31313.1 FkbM family methyltransferase [Roseibium sp. TrichSKD4]
MLHVNLEDVKLHLDENEVAGKIVDALLNKTYESDEAYCVKNLVKPGDRILEIGAGMGFITTILSQIEDVKVWSFDANPALIELLKRTATINNNNVASLNIGAFSAKAHGEMDFYIRQEFWMSSLYKEQGPYEEVIKIKTRNIDDFIRDNSINCLVMDIEGAEKEILEDAKLLGIERICVELHPQIYGHTGIGSINNHINGKGFRINKKYSSNLCISYDRESQDV